MSCKHPIPCILSARKKIRCKLWNLLHIMSLNDIFQISILIAVVTMCNTNRNTTLLRALQRHRTKAILMNMNNLIFRMCPKETPQLLTVPSAPWNKARNTIDFSTHRQNFFIIISFKVTMYQKIILHLTSIYMTIIIHQHSFKTTTPHIGNYL